MLTSFLCVFFFICLPVLAENSEILLQAGKEEVCFDRRQQVLYVLLKCQNCIQYLGNIAPHCFPQMLKLCSELEMVVSCCEARRDNLRETKELYVNF